MDLRVIIVLISSLISISTSLRDSQTSTRKRGNSQKSGQRQSSPIFDPDRVVFPDDMYDMRRILTFNKNNGITVIKNTTRNELPLNLAMRLNELGDIEAFMEEYVENKDQFHRDNNFNLDGTPSLGSRFGSSTKSTSGGFPIKTCNPVDSLIKLAPDTHPSDVFYLPECVHIKRCSGCCNTGLLTCQPVKTVNRTVKVRENKLSMTKNTLKYSKTFSVEVEEHLSCACRCRIQPHHCQSTQRYESQSCRCVCNDDLPDGRDTCEAFGKIWDEFTCSCDCPDNVSKHCTSESNFDNNFCSCV